MFKITIEETRIVTKPCGKEWRTVSTKEVAREDRYAAGPNEPKTRIEDVYGYTPEIEKAVEVKSTVLIQEVEKLNVGEVIRAINGLQKHQTKTIDAMIQKTPAYQTEDGTTHATLEAAQRHELKNLFDKFPEPEVIVENLMVNADKTISILKASGRKPRKAKTAPKVKQKPKAEAVA